MECSAPNSWPPSSQSCKTRCNCCCNVPGLSSPKGKPTSWPTSTTSSSSARARRIRHRDPRRAARLQDSGGDREHLGGICLNWGCIPTKALLRSAEIYHYLQHAGDYGLQADSCYQADEAGRSTQG